ncbi:uncharacterized protein LOC62_01G001092 [Vanrija pseudolonga]|uniref:Microbial-type PARG catalytic domain-containing protein n=1 Tax=Vanrija pseudolonga TaxID=143232 RepID=A0AAF1BF38_9TREE|nr:hypothetical protein LOC62_01G001092 [Vanrija pseudolonga]
MDHQARRARNARICTENEAIIRSGEYRSPGTSARINLASLVTASKGGTKSYTSGGTGRLLQRWDPSALPPSIVSGPSARASHPVHATTFEVTAETSTQAAERLAAGQAPAIAVLNFASAKHPGGGYLTGATAQEEDLCRSSALYTTLLAARDFYKAHRESSDARYTHRVIWSPDVPVYRDNDYKLLPMPYLVSFITVAAPNLGPLIKGNARSLQHIPELLEERAARFLAVAAHHGARTLVLGAWGCGVFQNDPVVVARVFRDLLLRPKGLFYGAFEKVVFAIYDPSKEQATMKAFTAAFAAAPNVSHYGGDTLKKMRAAVSLPAPGGSSTALASPPGSPPPRSPVPSPPPVRRDAPTSPQPSGAAQKAPRTGATPSAGQAARGGAAKPQRTLFDFGFKQK